MPASDYRYATRNAVHAGEKGEVYSNVGRLYFARGCKSGVDANLFAVLKILVDEFECSLNVNSLCTGRHSKGSRHYALPCLAADCNRVGRSRSTWQPFTVYNATGRAIADYLIKNGWMVGEGDPARPGLLLGPAHSALNPTRMDHSTHLHFSIARWAPGSPPGDIEDLVEPAEDV